MELRLHSGDSNTQHILVKIFCCSCYTTVNRLIPALDLTPISNDLAQMENNKMISCRSYLLSFGKRTQV